MPLVTIPEAEMISLSLLGWDLGNISKYPPHFVGKIRS